MLSETSSFLRICRTATDAIRGTSDFLQKGEIEKALLEMRREYIELLDDYQAAKDLISKLKNELNESYKQDETLQRYEPFPCPTGAIVYRLKDAHAAGAPPHYICATCVEEKNDRSFNRRMTIAFLCVTTAATK